ncbi:TetR/AcrR family transcriptional regulator [Microbacterium schleiferi]|uniref:Tetracyclin repressor-like C-terminal domain-containing protein n=1 Tax=Microbacterium schleiferi TaxID=69362 RepID=A0ABU7V4B8_9MICO
MRAAHEEGFVRPFRARIAASAVNADDADTRARMAAAVVGGLLYSLWIVRDEGLAHLERETLIGRYGALLQAAITG